jgi:hypothetical protein
MRKLFGFLAAAVFAVGVAAPASAAVVPFSGNITIFIGPLPGLPVPGAGLMTINGSAGYGKPVTHLSVPGGAFATALTIPLPNVFPIVQLKVAAFNNPVASFSSGAAPCGTPHPLVTCSGGAAIHGRSGIGGSAFVGIFGTAGSPGANLTIPLAVAGAGSMFNATSSLGITVMLSGAGWTTGTASVVNPQLLTTVTQMGGQGPNVPTGGGNSAGSIVMVSPLQVYNNATGGYLPSFAVWTLNYLKPAVPEPGVLLLLGSGVVGLAVYGRRKMKK